MPSVQNENSLIAAIRCYFDLMYDCDITYFDTVFQNTAQLHGFRDGQMVAWPAGEYREILASRTSPKALGAPREEEILLIDFASETQAVAKVKVRIGQNLFIDYLVYHKIDGDWKITSKAYHIC